jgi:hypothetical protein
MLDGAGALDFTELGLDGVLRWLQVLDIWPADMPPTINLELLGLSPDDIAAQRSEASAKPEDSPDGGRTERRRQLPR